MKRRALIAGGAVAALVLAYLAGRYSAPVRVEETATKVDQSAAFAAFLAKLETAQTKTTRRHVETRKTKRPDGTIEIVRVEDSGSDTQTNSTSNLTGTASATTVQATATRRVSEGGRPGWGIGASAAWDPRALSSRPERVSLEVDRRILGTVWLGVRASAEPDGAEPRVGAAIKVEF